MLPSSAVGRYYHDPSEPDTLFQIDTMAELPYFDAMHHGPRGVSKVRQRPNRSAASSHYALTAPERAGSDLANGQVNDVVELLFGERGLGLVHFFNRLPGEGRAHSTPPHQDAACVPFTGGYVAAPVPSVFRAGRL